MTKDSSIDQKVAIDEKVQKVQEVEMANGALAHVRATDAREIDEKVEGQLFVNGKFFRVISK